MPKGTEALNIKAMKLGIELAKGANSMKLREHEAKKVIKEYGSLSRQDS